MIDSREEDFVRKFIIAQKRDRLLFELGNNKKRREGIGRFCHGAEQLLISDKIYMSGEISGNRILELLNMHGRSEVSFVAAYNREIDRLELRNEDAVEQVIGNGMAAVIIQQGIAVIETEMTGRAERFVLLG